MSRFAKKPIVIPSGVQITIEGRCVKAKGPKGQLQYVFPEFFNVEQKEDGLWVKEEVLDDDSDSRGQSGSGKALLGTICARIKNLIKGVHEGYEKALELKGVGYRAQVKGKVLNLSLGFSHPVAFDIPEGIKIEMPNQTEIIVKGIDKQQIGQVAANIKRFRPVEPYKGKGVRYKDEQVSLKEVKKK